MRISLSQTQSFLLPWVFWVMLFAVGVWNVTLGYMGFSWADLNCLGGGDQNSFCSVLFQLRLPRVLSLFLAGWGLGVSGAVLQNFFKNPLADPALLGVSSGAGLVMLAGLMLFSGASALVWMGAGSVVGGILVIILLYLFANFLGFAKHSESLILMGVAMNVLFSALTQVLFFYVQSQQLRSYMAWSLGASINLSWPVLGVCGFFSFLGLVVCLCYNKALNVLALGKSQAQALGLDWARAKNSLLFGVACFVGSSVALVGPLAFVGLLSPHLARLIVRVSPARIVWWSGAVGVFLLWAGDGLSLLCREVGVPFGVWVTLLGVPALLVLLAQMRQREGAS